MPNGLASLSLSFGVPLREYRSVQVLEECVAVAVNLEIVGVCFVINGLVIHGELRNLITYTQIYTNKMSNFAKIIICEYKGTVR